MVNILGILANISEIPQNRPINQNHASVISKKEIWKHDPINLSFKILEPISAWLAHREQIMEINSEKILKRLEILNRLTWFLLNVTNRKGLPVRALDKLNNSSL